MKARLYFSYGMTKTGSTLAFRLTQRFFQRNGYEQPLVPGEFLGEDRVMNFIILPTAEQLQGIVRFAEEHDTCIVLKTHSAPTPEMVEMVRNGTAYAHVVFRDPREVALSMIDHGKRNRELGSSAFTEILTLKDAEAAIENQISYLEEWLRLPGVFPAFYDDFAWTLKPLIVWLRRQTGLKERSIKGVLVAFNSKIRSQYNKGTKSRWKEDMTAAEAAAFRKRFSKFYLRLMYMRWWPFRPFLMKWNSLQ